MMWLARIKWWLRLPNEVQRYARLWKSADQQRQALAVALKDCTEARQQAIAQRDATIQQLATQVAALSANQQPLMRYMSALGSEQFTINLIPAVEAAKVGIYRSTDATRQLYATAKVLSEDESVGWELLNTDDAVRALRLAARRAMGVWN